MAAHSLKKAAFWGMWGVLLLVFLIQWGIIFTFLIGTGMGFSPPAIPVTSLPLYPSTPTPQQIYITDGNCNATGGQVTAHNLNGTFADTVVSFGPPTELVPGIWNSKINATFNGTGSSFDIHFWLFEGGGVNINC